MNRSTFARLAAFVLFAAMLATLLPAAAQTPRAAPANDNFASRMVVSPRELMSGSFTVIGVQNATIQSGALPAEPVPSCTGGAFSFLHSVWFELQAPFEVELVIDTFESSLNSGATNNTVIAVYTAAAGQPASFGTLTERWCSQNGTGAGFLTWAPMTRGTHYLQVGSSTALSTTSSYKVAFGSRFELLVNNDFGTDTPSMSGWTVTGTGTKGDKAVCGVTVPRVVDNCFFRFKTSPGENSTLKQKVSGLASLPHDTGPTVYSEFVLTVDSFTERSQTDATATIIVKFTDGTKEKNSRSLDTIGAIYVDPLTGKVPKNLTVKIKHTGTSGRPIYVTDMRNYYAPGATGRSTEVLPLPDPPSR